VESNRFVVSQGEAKALEVCSAMMLEHNRFAVFADARAGESD
jgi:hypothetical protein